MKKQTTPKKIKLTEISIIVSVLLVALSIAYYLVLFLPQREEVEIEKQKADSMYASEKADEDDDEIIELEKEERARIEDEERARKNEEKEKIKACEVWQVSCRDKIDKISDVEYSARISPYGVSSLKEIEDLIEKLEEYIDDREDGIESCKEFGSDKQIEDCVEGQEEHMEDAEKDIDDLEELEKKVKKEIDALLAGECKGYENPCE